MREDLLFVEYHPGRKVSSETNEVKSLIIEMRKKYYSVPDIKVVLDGLGALHIREEYFQYCIRGRFFSVYQDVQNLSGNNWKMHRYQLKSHAP